MFEVECVRIECKRKTLDVLYSMTPEGIMLEPKPVRDRLLSQIFYSPTHRYSTLVLNGSTRCGEFRDYMVDAVAREYQFKPWRCNKHLVEYWIAGHKVVVHVVNGMSRYHVRGLPTMNFVYLDKTIKEKKLDEIRKCVTPMLHARGTLMIEEQSQ